MIGGKYVDKSLLGLNINYDKFINNKGSSLSSRYKVLRRTAPVNAIANELGITRKTCLDIGCGSGEFLKILREYGYDEVFGVDIRSYSEMDYKTYIGDFLALDINRNFSVITMWHVLEHLKNPLEFLRKTYDLLESTGFIVIEVPIIDSWQFKLFGTKWRCIRGDHLNYFSIKSLYKIIERAGFKKYSSSWQGSLGLTYYLQRTIARDFDKVIQHHPFMLPIKKTYLTLCSNLHLGDYYRLFCVKA
jgi:SAM-dependent methyltransferase